MSPTPIIIYLFCIGKLIIVLIHYSIILSAFLKVEDCHTAEVVTTLKGTTFRVAESSPDMYASVDAVADRLVSPFGFLFSRYATVISFFTMFDW